MAGETTFYTRASGQSSDRLRGNAEHFLPTVRSFPSIEENQAHRKPSNNSPPTFFTARSNPGKRRERTGTDRGVGKTPLPRLFCFALTNPQGAEATFEPYLAEQASKELSLPVDPSFGTWRIRRSTRTRRARRDCTRGADPAVPGGAPRVLVRNAERYNVESQPAR